MTEGLHARLPRFQLHISLERLEPLVMPFTTDPNEMGAFVKLSDLEAALREASRPQEATGKATVYPEVKAPNNWVSAGDQWRDRPPHWPVDRDIIRNHVVENRPVDASRLASPPATTEDK